MQAKVIDTLVTLLTSSCDVQGQSVLPPSDVQVCEAGVVSSCVRSEHHGYLEGRRRRRGDKEKEQGIGSERAGNNKIEPKKRNKLNTILLGQNALYGRVLTSISEFGHIVPLIGEMSKMSSMNSMASFSKASRRL